MILVDVNVLVAASVIRHPDHESARRFLVERLSSDEVLVPDAVWSGFVRVATSRRVFEKPLTLSEAASYVNAITRAPGYRSVPGLADGIESFLDMCAAYGATGNLVSDAYIAAVARAHACPVATFDRDFGRFEGIEAIRPS